MGIGPERHQVPVRPDVELPILEQDRHSTDGLSIAHVPHVPRAHDRRGLEREAGAEDSGCAGDEAAHRPIHPIGIAHEPRQRDGGAHGAMGSPCDLVPLGAPMPMARLKVAPGRASAKLGLAGRVPHSYRGAFGQGDRAVVGTRARECRGAGGDEGERQRDEPTDAMRRHGGPSSGADRIVGWRRGSASERRGAWMVDARALTNPVHYAACRGVPQPGSPGQAWRSALTSGVTAGHA